MLGVNHATVLRRVSSFEQATGVPVFDRTARGYRVAPRRGRIIAAIRAMEEAALGVARALDAARAPLAGTVRVTSTDTLCLTVLPRIVARVMSAAEGLTIADLVPSVAPILEGRTALSFPNADATLHLRCLPPTIS